MPKTISPKPEPITLGKAIRMVLESWANSAERIAKMDPGNAMAKVEIRPMNAGYDSIEAACDFDFKGLNSAIRRVMDSTDDLDRARIHNLDQGFKSTLVALENLRGFQDEYRTAMADRSKAGRARAHALRGKLFDAEDAADAILKERGMER